MKRPKLFPYQEEGLRRVLERPFSFLFMDPGTGKTAVAIRAMDEYYREGKISRVIIFVPNTLKYNWQREIVKFSHLDPREYEVMRLDKNKPGEHKKLEKLIKSDPTMCTLTELKSQGFKGKKRDVVSQKLLIIITNYEKSRVMEKRLKTFKPQMMIIDELHKLRNPNAAISKAIYRLASPCKVRVGLTGTPICKGYENLFMQYKIIDDTIFGNSYSRFEGQYIRKGGYMGHDIVGYKNVSKLKRIVSKTSYRVKLDQVAKLPPLEYIPIPCELPPQARRVYDELSDHLFATIEREVSRRELKSALRSNGVIYSPQESYVSLFNKASPYVNTTTCGLMITQMLRLQQITGGFVTLDSGEIQNVGSGKITELMSIIDEKQPVVVVCKFVPEMDYLEEQLREKRPKLRIRSYREVKKRDQYYEEFQGGLVDVLLIQISSGSVGLNLQRASSLVFYSYSFSYEEYYQAIARIKRQGQKHLMKIYTLMANDSIDEDIIMAIEDSEVLSRKLIG